jgi:hypothetical protein
VEKIIKYFANPAMKIVIASETKQSHLFEEIATHLSGARNDGHIKQFSRSSLDSGI